VGRGESFPEKWLWKNDHPTVYEAEKAHLKKARLENSRKHQIHPDRIFHEASEADEEEEEEVVGEDDEEEVDPFEHTQEWTIGKFTKRTPEEIKREEEERKKWRDEHELVQVGELGPGGTGTFKWVRRSSRKGK
jgi:hypothetical protein